MKEATRKIVWLFRCKVLGAKIAAQRWNDSMRKASNSIRRFNVIAAHIKEQTDPKNENNSEVNRIGDYLKAMKNER
jgi:hypothetical protein